MIINFPIDEWANKTPDHLAVVSDTCHLTYRELAAATQQILSLLPTPLEQKRIAILLPITIENVVIFTALLRSKILAIPLNTYLPDEKVLELLDESKCDYIFCEERRSAAFADKAIISENIFGDNLLQEWIPQKIDINDPCSVIFTSGSSGKPKGVVHSFANHYYSALGSNMHIPLAYPDRWLLSLPLYHVAGIAILFRCFVAGSTVVLSQTVPRKVSHASMVTTQLQRFLKENLSADTLELKHILLGGSAIPHSLIEKAIERGFAIYTSYGSSEMSSQIATTNKINDLSQVATAKPLRYREVAISEEGEILVKGKTLFCGYLRNGKIIDATDQEGWFHTGDYGAMNEDGYLQIYGRKDHMFISGGENIHPQEIEQHLSSIPGIEQAIVVPAAHQEFGYRPIAFIETKSSINAEEIKTKLALRLPRFKIPDDFRSWPENIPHKGIKIDRSFFHHLIKNMKSN